MDDKFNRINAKLDKIDERLDKVEQVLVRNTTIMEEHHRRSTTLETHVSKIEGRFYKELGPIKKHVDMVSYGVKGIMWVFAGISASIGLLLALRQLGIVLF
jgi:tetrahydromethanopterin S-methyltransferase subunit G